MFLNPRTLWTRGSRTLHHIPPWLGHPEMSLDVTWNSETLQYIRTSMAGTSWDDSGTLHHNIMLQDILGSSSLAQDIFDLGLGDPT